MALYLPDLDSETRKYMLDEFDIEQAGLPYLSTVLSAYGRSIWPVLMREAIELGDDVTLHDNLRSIPQVFQQEEPYTRQGVTRMRAINALQAAERLATSEFNTWYVRGVAARFIAEGITHVLIYRAAVPRWEVAACAEHEGALVSVKDVYDGHRASYWPFVNPGAFSVPFQAGCHHSICKVAFP